MALKSTNSNWQCNIRRDLAVLLLALCVCGCASSSPVYRQGEGLLPSAITAKDRWTITGTLPNIQSAIDDDLTTAAMSNRPRAGDSVTIDLAKPCLMQTLIVEHGAGENGYAHMVQVATSTDGVRFDVQYETLGTRQVTLILLPTPVLARFIRIRAIKPGRQPWSVAEIYVQ